MTPEPWSVLPFVLLLAMIATGPLFYPRFWHKNYPAISVALGALMVKVEWIEPNGDAPTLSTDDLLRAVARADSTVQRVTSN